jgi:hypothetical protein
MFSQPFAKLNSFSQDCTIFADLRPTTAVRESDRQLPDTTRYYNNKVLVRLHGTTGSYLDVIRISLSLAFAVKIIFSAQETIIVFPGGCVREV